MMNLFLEMGKHINVSSVYFNSFVYLFFFLAKIGTEKERLH